jgi:hypothetical protein
MNVKWEAWELFEQIYKHTSLRGIVDADYAGKWAFDMVWGMVYAARKYVALNIDTYKNTGTWPHPKWSWGKDCQTPTE